MHNLIGKIVPKLTKEQVRVLDEIINGAEIQEDFENEQWVYSLVKENGDVEPIRRDTFEKLKSCQLIKAKYHPSVDVTRWG